MRLHRKQRSGAARDGQPKRRLSLVRDERAETVNAKSDLERLLDVPQCEHGTIWQRLTREQREIFLKGVLEAREQRADDSNAFASYVSLLGDLYVRDASRKGS